MIIPKLHEWPWHHIEITDHISTKVKPMGALDYPNLDQAFFRIVGPTNLSKSNFKVDAKQSGKRLQIDIDTEVDFSSIIFPL